LRNCAKFLRAKRAALTDVRFDEIENVLASLDLLAATAPLVKKRCYRSLWKWMIIAAHDAVQGAIVCAIADTTGTNVLSEKSARKMLDFLEGTSKEYPSEFLADFKTLTNRANVALLPRDAKDIRMLHDFRNGFVHFTPKGWTIEGAGLPRITDAALGLVERLMQSDGVRYRLTGNQQRRVRDSIKAVRTALDIKAAPQ
jgi:hypothetical protein